MPTSSISVVYGHEIKDGDRRNTYRILVGKLLAD
jgi:hypothetical protein